MNGLKRRREAALRLPPLPCGCRDPLTTQHREGRCRFRRKPPAPAASRVWQISNMPPWPDVHRADRDYLEHVGRLVRMPSYAELERLRWGGPRRQFGRPRIGDYAGAGKA